MKRSGKRSLVSGILALSLVLAGTGYAYWTDTLNVTTKATTGEFGVEFVDLGLYAQYGDEARNGWSIIDGVGDNGYVNDGFFTRGSSNYNIIAKPGSIEAYKNRAKGFNSVEFDAKLVDAKVIKKGAPTYVNAKALGSGQIEINIENMYPGYAQAFRSDIVNVGDIAAKLSNLKVDVKNADDKMEKMLGVAIYVTGEFHQSNGNQYDVFKLGQALGVAPEDMFTMGGVQFVRLSALKGVDLKDKFDKNEILCHPSDNRMDIFLGVAMDPDAEGVYTTGTVENMKDNDDALTQNKEATILVDLLWDQFNVGKGIDAPANILKEQNK